MCSFCSEPSIICCLEVQMDTEPCRELCQSRKKPPGRRRGGLPPLLFRPSWNSPGHTDRLGVGHVRRGRSAAATSRLPCSRGTAHALEQAEWEGPVAQRPSQPRESRTSFLVSPRFLYSWDPSSTIMCSLIKSY